MQKIKQKILSSALVFALLTPSSMVMATSDSLVENTTRLGGIDRYDTAVKISQSGWQGGADSAILAPGNDANLVDALASAPLSGALDAPVLLTESTQLSAATKAELARLRVKNVYIVTGESVITANIETELTNMGISVKRLGGHDRFETALNIAKEVKRYSPIHEIAVANAYSKADALSVAAVAAMNKMPIILTENDALSTEASAFIQGLALDKSYVIGGNAVVGDAVLMALPQSIRLGGYDRFDTNQEVLTQFEALPQNGTLYFANGNNASLVDALTGAPLAGKNKSLLVLSNTDGLPVESRTFVNNEWYLTHPVLLGGEAVLKDTVPAFLEYSTPLSSIDPANPSQIQGKVRLTGTDTLTNAVVDSSVLVNTSGNVLKNVKLTGGTLFVDPGVSSSVSLDTVEADKVIVLSNDNLTGLALKNSQIKNLVVTSLSPSRIATDATTTIETLSVFSSAVIHNEGTITFTQIENHENAPITLEGTFKRVLVSGNSFLAATSATIETLAIGKTRLGEVLQLKGGFPKMTLSYPSQVELISGMIDEATDFEGTTLLINPGASILNLAWVEGTTVSGGGLVNGLATSTTPTAPRKNTAKAITSFTFETFAKIPGIIDETSKSITVTVPYGTDVTQLTPLILTSLNASISPTGVKDFTVPALFTVTAQDGSTAIYTVIVTVAPKSSEKAILSLTSTDTGFIDATIDESAKTITLRHQPGADISKITPVLTLSPYATVSPGSEFMQDFTNGGSYTVTAQDGTTQAYAVTTQEITP